MTGNASKKLLASKEKTHALYERLAGAIKQAREARRLTQQDFCQKYGFRLTTLQKWERGVTAPDFDNLVRLAKALGRPIEEVLGVEMTRESERKEPTLEFLHIALETFWESAPQGAKEKMVDFISEMANRYTYLHKSPTPKTRPK